MQILSMREGFEQYDDLLDDCYTTEVAGIQFGTSYALKNLDPVAYREGAMDYFNSLAEDGILVEGYTDGEAA